MDAFQVAHGVAGKTDEERAYYSHNQDAWAKLAPFYDYFTFPVRRLRREVVELSDAGTDARVLDVATGTGAQALAFADRCGEVIGIDLSERMLEIARQKSRRPNLSFLRADAAALPLGDGSFDVACISFALHEMPPSVRERVLREMVRVARPGGTIVVVDYALPRYAPGSWLVYHLVKLYGARLLRRVRALDFDALLRRMETGPWEEHARLLGAVKILTAVKRGPSLVRPSPRRSESTTRSQEGSPWK